MEEWKDVKVSELLQEISMGPFGSNIKVDNFIDSGVPVLNGSNLQGYKLNEDSFNYVSEEKADSLGKANAHRGDIVITHRGTLGQIIYIPQDSKFNRYVISQSQFRLKLKSEIVRPDYFVYFFHTRIGQHKILMNASQVGVPALARPTTTFKEVSIPIPPLSVQDRIMAILLCIDDKIELDRKINSNLEEQAKALFKSWFINFEPFKDGKFVDSELGKIPEGWNVKSASDIFNITIGKTPPRKESKWFTKGIGNVWVSISDMKLNGAFIGHSSEKLSDDAIAKFNIVMVPKDTILLSFKLTIGRVAISSCDLTTNEAIARFSIDNPRLREFTYLYLKNYNFQSLGSTSSIATAVNSKIIKSMPFLLPDADTMESFHKLSKPLFDQIEVTQKQTDCLASIRDVLLPKLMSGEIEVK